MSEIQSKRARPGGLAAFAVLLSTVSYGAMDAAAQNADEVEVRLPPVTVQGATLDRPKTGARPDASGEEAAAPLSQGTGSANLWSGSAAAGSQSSGVPIDEIGSAVTVVTGAQLKAQEIRHVADALRSLPGVHVARPGGPGAATQVRLRGAEANHTLVLIDGVEANDTSNGEFDFADLLTDDIERIELIRGGQSGLYGSRAIGGVINITTKGGRGPLTFAARTEGGSFNTRDVAGRVSAGNERMHFAASAQLRKSDGFNFAPIGNEDDPYRQTAFNFKTGMTIADGLTVDLNVRRTSKLLDYDAFTGPLGVLNTAVDAPLQADAVTWLAGGRVNWDMMDGALSHTLFANHYDGNIQNYDKTDVAGTLTTNKDQRLRFGYQGTVRFDTGLGLRHAVSGLIENERESFTPIGGWNDGEKRERERLAYAGEYRGRFFDRLFPTFSVRHEDNDTFDDFTTWKAAVSVKLPEVGMRPHASVGTAAALPGMFEQFGSALGTFVGNPNLVPEESFGWDAGIEFSLLAGRALVDVTYFKTDLTNEIAGWGNTLINLVGKSERQGVEVSSRVALMPGLVVGGSYTFLEAMEPDGGIEVRRARHSGRLDVNYTFDGGRGNFNIAAMYNGRNQDTAFFEFPAFTYHSVRVTLDDYLLVNVAASYKITPGVEVYGRVENAFDANYQEVFGYETAGIGAYAGLRFKYEDPTTLSWAAARP